jgi:hypothetical protein
MELIIRFSPTTAAPTPDPTTYKESWRWDSVTPFLEDVMSMLYGDTKCTIVNFESWPPMQDADAKRLRWVDKSMALEMPPEYLTKFMESVDEKLVLLTEAEYRASIGEEMYALESYLEPLK